MRSVSVLLLLAGLAVAGACQPASKSEAPGEPGEQVPLYENLGTHHHPITTKNALAQEYFDQGLRLVYGFNHDEARRAFEEAARLDPACAMAWWGVALTLGPNFNLPTDADREKAAVRAVEKARSLASRASEAERGYIEALAKRYSEDPASDRAAKDRTYAAAMRELAKRYPDDLDAATLQAEALMDLRPWKLWMPDGQPALGTNEILSVLESVLSKDPDHLGANHYYIHAVEASPQPERGLPAAERLPGLAPGAGHLVHMPAHIYQRVGRYADSAEANEKAIAADEDYLAKAPDNPTYRLMYYSHNIHFFCAAASMGGRSAEALEAARDLLKQVPPEAVKEMPMAEYFSPVLLWTLARFGKWDDVLNEPRPPGHMLYTTGMWHYVRGLAFAAKGRIEDAEGELRALSEIAAKVPADLILVLNSASDLLEVASEVLAGEIAARKGRIDEAVRHLEEAVREQDALHYDEPPPWYYPVRQSLGAVLLDTGRSARAEQVYREDLKRNPENGWSLHGLARSLLVQGATKEAADVEKRFDAAWAHADVTLEASRF